MNIDPRHFRVLLAVVRQGSFSAAAEFLNMTQPSVSVSIAQLEDRLKCRVVNRDRKGATLTHEGEIIFRHALAMESVLSNAVAEIDLLARDISGPITIGGTTGAFLALVPQVLSHLQQDAALDVTLADMPDEQIETALRTRQITFALCTARQDRLPDDLEEIPILSEPFVLVAAVGKLPAEGLTIEQAAQRPWVFPRVNGETKRRLEAVFISAGIPLPSNVIRCDILATQKEIIRQSDTIALLPRSAVQTELDNGLLCSAPLVGAPRPRRLVALKLRSAALPPLATRFIDLACGVYGQEI